MLARCVATLKPPPELTLSQWADRYRMLSAESSAEPGRWHTDKAPYQREIMDAIGDAHIRRVVIMCAAQLGKTELLLNILGYFMAYGTHTGEQALDRDFGIDISTTDYPQESAQALLAAEYVRKTKMYEPRARVVRVEWTDSKAHDGNMTPKVVIDLV